MRAPRALAAGALIAVLALLGVVLPQGAPAAAAAEPESWVSITLTDLSPALPGRDGTLTLRGTVRNTGKVTLFNLQAIPWRSLDPIQSEEGMQLALDSAANDPIGLRVYDVFQNIPSEADRTLRPGESTPFTLTLDVAKLTLPDIDGVYLVGVHVRGRTVENGPDITLGRARVFLPMVATPPANAAQLTTVVLLSSRPSLLTKGVLADDHLAAEIGAEGRLTALLRAADTDATSFAVDPELIEEVQTMRAGYSVRAADGTTRPGTGQAAAGRWLSAYSQVAGRRNGFRLLYAHPDVAALVHAGLWSVVTDGEAASRAVTLTAGLPLLAMPANGAADSQTVTALSELRPAAILLNDNTTGQSRPLLAGPANTPVVSVATATFGGGPGPDPRNTPVHLRQRALSETWLEASAAGAGDTVGQVRVITTADQARGNQGDADAPWLRRESLGDLLDSAPAQWPGRYHYPESAQTRELGPAQIGETRQLRTGFATWSELLVDGREVQAAGKGAVVRTASSSWRQATHSWRAYVDPLQATVSDVLENAVKIVATPRVITSAHRGLSFPITIRNNLKPPAAGEDPDRDAVRVQLDFTSANSQRLTVAPIGALQVPAGASVTENAQVEAKTNGSVQVTAQLHTTSGTTVGRAVSIEVKATQAGTIGWIIAIAAGVVLVGTSALRIRQVSRERSAAGAATDTLPPAQVVPAADDSEHPDVAGGRDGPEDRPDRSQPESLDV